MSRDPRATIQDRWHSSQVPQIDGVLFGSGEIVLMRCISFADPSTNRIGLSVSPIARSTLNSVLEFDADPWTHVTPLSSLDVPERDERLICGEGSQGNEGFVASCAASEDRLHWVAFFTRSNPFIEVRTTNETILASTSHGHVWAFPAAHPERVRVTW
jgi:hypothetical protein